VVSKMIVRYFNDLTSLVDAVCSDLKGRWSMYGAVHVGRVFGLKRYSDGGGELTEWDCCLLYTSPSPRD